MSVRGADHQLDRRSRNHFQPSLRLNENGSERPDTQHNLCTPMDTLDLSTPMPTRLRTLGAGPLLASVVLLLMAVALAACVPAEESENAEPWAAPVAPTDAIAPTLAPAADLPTAVVSEVATPLPTAALSAVATLLPAATALPVSAEDIVQTVPDAQADEAKTRYQRLLRAEWDTDFTRTTISFDEIMTGGPPKDGIPSIDNPRFESIADADFWLDDLEPVQVVDLNGDVRAYPVQVMVWHELVNDTVGGEPVVITF